MVVTRSKPWTAEEDNLFRTMVEANVSPDVIATKMNRTVSALKARAYTIGLPLKWFRPRLSPGTSIHHISSGTD
jgi:hypothetical protein